MCFGSNQFGQLGVPDPVEESRLDLVQIVGICCGDNCTGAWDVMGRAWAWGKLKGPKFKENGLEPLRLQGPHNCFITQMSMGATHVCVMSCSSSVEGTLKDVQTYCSRVDVSRDLSDVSSLEHFHLQNAAHCQFVRELDLPRARLSLSELCYGLDSRTGSLNPWFDGPLVLYGFGKNRKESLHVLIIPQLDEGNIWRCVEYQAQQLSVVKTDMRLVVPHPTELKQQESGLEETLKGSLEIRLMRQSACTRMMVRLTLTPYFAIPAEESRHLFMVQMRVLSLPSWQREEIAMKFSNVFTKGLLLLLAQSGPELDVHYDGFYEGLAHVAHFQGLVFEIFSKLVETEVAELAAHSHKNDVLATAFRAESPCTGLFRGICSLPSSRKYLLQILEPLANCGEHQKSSDLVDLILKAIRMPFTETSQFVPVLQAMKVMIETLLRNKMPEALTDQVVLFFFFTRFLCPQVIRANDSYRSIMLSVSKELGLLVNSMDSEFLVKAVKELCLGCPKESGKEERLDLKILFSELLGITPTEKNPTKYWCLMDATIVSKSIGTSSEQQKQRKLVSTIRSISELWCE